MALELAGALDAWLKDMMAWILNGGLLCALGFLFRSRRTDVAGYLWLDPKDDESRPGDLEVDTSFMSDPNRASLIQWEVGMALPPPPSRNEPQEEIKNPEDDYEMATNEVFCQL